MIQYLSARRSLLHTTVLAFAGTGGEIFVQGLMMAGFPSQSRSALSCSVTGVGSRSLAAWNLREGRSYLITRSKSSTTAQCSHCNSQILRFQIKASEQESEGRKTRQSVSLLPPAQRRIHPISHPPHAPNLSSPPATLARISPRVDSSPSILYSYSKLILPHLISSPREFEKSSR